MPYDFVTQGSQIILRPLKGGNVHEKIPDMDKKCFHFSTADDLETQENTPSF